MERKPAGEIHRTVPLVAPSESNDERVRQVAQRIQREVPAAVGSVFCQFRRLDDFQEDRERLARRWRALYVLVRQAEQRVEREGEAGAVALVGRLCGFVARLLRVQRRLQGW